MKASELRAGVTIRECEDQPDLAGWTVKTLERRYETPEVGPGFFSFVAILLTLERENWTLKGYPAKRELFTETRTAWLKDGCEVKVR